MTIAVAATVAVILAIHPSASMAAVSLSDRAAEDRAALARAEQRFRAAQARAAEIDAQVAAASAALDAAIAEQARCQELLRTRVAAMYRSDEAGALALILSASTIQDLAARLELLDRMARQDALAIEALKAAREESRRSAEELLELQSEQARIVDEMEREVAAARTELAASESALREYEARIAAAAAAAAAKRAAAAAKPAPDQQATGSGEWGTGVASHYGINFTGRGASGEKIGPYSMMLAHRTLPFGTLIEFEYKGNRAVARVADRGPYVAGRDFDLGPGVARALGFSGVHEVRYRIISQ